MRLPKRLTAAAVGILALAAGAAPRPPAAAELPVGKWRVTFLNGVVEACEIRRQATVTSADSARTADGKAATKNGEVVLTFDDDRVERWTPAGRRMLVEHWYPAAQFPAGPPVLGIAERAEPAAQGK